MRLNAIAAALAVNFALAGGLAYLWSDGDRTRWAEPTALSPSLEDLAAAPASEPADVTRYRETVERPLFAVNRRPAPRKDPDAEAQAAADSLKDVRLLGTYGAGERGGIVVVSGGKVQRVAVGESIGGWKVAGGGQGRSAELVRPNGERRQLELALNATAPPAPAAAAAGKEGGQVAAQAGAAEPAGTPDAGQSGRSERATAQREGSGRSSAGEEARRQRLDRYFQRRAQRGQASPTK